MTQADVTQADVTQADVSQPSSVSQPSPSPSPSQPPPRAVPSVLDDPGLRPLFARARCVFFDCDGVIFDSNGFKIVAMRRALDASPEVALYLQYVDGLSLGWSVESRQVALPAFDGPLRLRHARAAGRPAAAP